jgi:hypothetical protein
MPTLKQKLSDGCYIIVGKIYADDDEDFCTWQVDNGKAVRLLQDRGIDTNNLPADFPRSWLKELIDLKYVSTEGTKNN